VTATPPRADPDLRALAAEAILSRASNLRESPYDDPAMTLVGTESDLADVVLAAVLPAHRQQVLAEAVEVIEALTEKVNTDRERPGLRHAASILRRLAAAAPQAGPASTETAEPARAVPQEAPEAHRPSEAVKWGSRMDRSPNVVHRPVGYDFQALANSQGRPVHVYVDRGDGWLLYETRPPRAAAPAVPEDGAGGQRATDGDALDRFRRCPIACGWELPTTEFDDEIGLRAARGQHLDRHTTYEVVAALETLAADRDRLAARVAHYQRVIEGTPADLDAAWRQAARDQATERVVDAAKAWRKVMLLIPGLDSREAAALDNLASAVDALPDNTGQTEDDRG